jgi:hypothetical protein
MYAQGFIVVSLLQGWGFKPCIASYIIFFSMQVTCHTHLTRLDLIIPALFVEERRLCNPSLCSFLKPLILSLSRPHVLFPSILMAVLGLPVMWERRFHIHTEHQVDYKDSSWLGCDAASTGSVWPFRRHYAPKCRLLFTARRGAARRNIPEDITLWQSMITQTELQFCTF